MALRGTGHRCHTHAPPPVPRSRCGLRHTLSRRRGYQHRRQSLADGEHGASIMCAVGSHLRVAHAAGPCDTPTRSPPDRRTTVAMRWRSADCETCGLRRGATKARSKISFYMSRSTAPAPVPQYPSRRCLRMATPRLLRLRLRLLRMACVQRGQHICQQRRRKHLQPHGGTHY